MLFEKNQEEFLIRKLSRNEAILFTGAGFSLEAENVSGEKLLTAKQFCEKIWNFLGLDGTYDGTSLPILYDLMLNKGIKRELIVEFLEQTFLVKKFPDFYRFLSLPFWFKIYTTNIDNLIDLVYKKFSQTELDILRYPKDEFRERDLSLDKLQTIYLNGKLPCFPEEVIFSRKQYSRASLSHQPLYNQFINDYSTTTTIFIGTSIEEPIFEQYLSAREGRPANISENRPRSFLIDPFISNAKVELLKLQYNIECIKAYPKDFLQWIESIAPKLPIKIDVLKTTLPSLADLLESKGFKELYREAISEFSISFSRVSPHPQGLRKSKNYLLGTTPTWSDIYYNLDAPRKINLTIYEEVEQLYHSSNKLNFLAILGTAGSGKSTLLKRLAYNLALNGRTVFFSYSEYLPDINSIIETLKFINQKVILFFDNGDLVLAGISKMLEKLSALTFPPIIILGSRTNIFDKVSRRIDPIAEVKEFRMPNLDVDEIKEVIKVLDQNNLLGNLKGMSDRDRIKEFEHRARKQILVAMREATKGEEFDAIIKSEFNEIEPHEAKVLCLCVAIITDAGFTISKQDFVALSHVKPAIALHYLERTLMDIILKAGIKEDKLMLRHRTIAGYIVDNCVNTDMLKEAYIRVLSALASELNFRDYNNRKFTLYKEIINHNNLYFRFKNDIEKAREVYETLIQYFRDDFHFWLQYGSLELEGKGGDLILAENYLNQAESLYPNNFFVLHALANMYYIKSVHTNSIVEASDFKREADSILIDFLKNRNFEDAHTYHIYCRGNYDYIANWVKGLDNIKRDIEELLKIAKQGVEVHPYNKRLNHIYDVINRAYLLTGVRKEIVFPLILPDTEEIKAQ